MNAFKVCRWCSVLSLLTLLISIEATIADYAYVRELRPEKPTDRQARHKRVAQRRAGPIILVHRGASAMAPENSLEAYASAMNYGADGCEVDIRRTSDGVLVLFHDDMLDRLLDEVGDISELTFAEAMKARPRLLSGRVLPCHGPPTFAALLEVARQRAMLLHLDIKQPGLEEDLAHWLDYADMWDHIVAVSTYHSTNLMKNPKLKLLKYKAGLYEGRRDLDPDAVKAALPSPEEMVMVDDPRVVAWAMKRPSYQPVALWKGLCVEVDLKNNTPPSSTNFTLHGYLTSLGPPKHSRALEVLEADFPEWNQPEGDAIRRQQRAERILERTWAARAMAVQEKNSSLIKGLEEMVRHRSLHQDWRVHGLDGATAARSLASLRSTRSVPVLIEAFRRVDPDLQKIVNPEWGQYPLAWSDHRFKLALLPALGELPSPTAKEFLWEYISLSEAQARELGPPQFEEATKALLRQKLADEELRALLNNVNTAVRGTALLACVDRPTHDHTQALKAAAPWALQLPRARRCKTAR